MYPSLQKPYAGIFVKNQYQYLKHHLNLSVDIFTMKRTFTNRLGSFCKYFAFFIRFIPYLFRRYDIIHVHFFGYHLYLAKIYKKIYRNVKIVTTLHGSDIYSFKDNFLKNLSKEIDYLIAVSNFQNNLLEKLVGLSADTILCAGIRKDIFNRHEQATKIYDFVFVGSFYAAKGIDIFINALKRITFRLNICFVGSGEFYGEINALSSYTNHNVDILANLAQYRLVEIYNKSRFLVLPSRDDSFGLVVTEALYCGVPAIVSNVSGPKEQIINHFNGFIINNSVEDLKQMLITTSKLPVRLYCQLANNALRSNKQYSLEHVCTRLNDIYADLYSKSF